MPDYQIKQWNEANLPPSNAYLTEALSRRLWSKVSNYVRLYALLTEGGVYLDTDVEVVRRLDPLLNDECFIGFQQREDGVDWVNNAILGAVRGHSYIRSCLEATTDAFDNRGEILRSPQASTIVLRRLGLRAYGRQAMAGGVTVYPVEYFYPYAWDDKFSPACVTADTYTIHRWEGSWFRPSRHERMVRGLRSAVGRIPGARQVRDTLLGLGT